MKITRTTLLSAFARMLEDRLDSGMLLSHRDLVEDWASTGLRTDDLDALVEHLYGMRWLDRTLVGEEPWYRLTPAGTIELRLCRESFWERLRDRLNLMRLQLRRSAPPPRHRPQARRRSDRIASETL